MNMVRTFSLLLLTALVAACAKKPQPPASEPAQATQPSPAAQAAAMDANVSEFGIGEYSAVALKDGEIRIANDGKTFGIGHSPEEVANLLRAAGVPTNELVLGLQPLFVKAGDKGLLFDTGAGRNMGESGGRLVASMQQAKIDPASVTDIFVSHAHGDHVGGLVDASGALAFPNATIHMSAAEWDFLKGMDDKAAANVGITNHAALIAAVTPKIAAFAPGSEILPGSVKAVEIRGHTPGHSGYLITSTSGKDSLLYIGDAAHHYIVSVQQPDWTVNFDTDAPTAQASRRELIARSATTGQRIYAVHFPFPGLGKFEQRGDGFVWVAER
ncbi:MAG TPA: MBL fold metallo-hydrolase [Povalibacter sp.]|nr:MBL fold metallo-hydrolase [Povalibacter sp.]